MKRKLLALGLASVLSVSLAACGGAAPSGAGQPAASAQSDAPAAPAEETVPADEPAEAETEEPENTSGDIGVVSGAEAAAPEEETSGAEGTVPEEGAGLHELFETMDIENGVHMNYDMFAASMNITTNYDVQAKTGKYYSRGSMELAGSESASVTCYLDGNMYTLDEKAKTGILVSDGLSNMFDSDPLTFDNLYSLMKERWESADYTEETREINGTACYAQVFPGDGEYVPEVAFCFGAQGNLVYVIKSPLENSSFDLGEITYTVHAVDSAVNDSLFDISGYEITELSSGDSEGDSAGE